LIQAVLTFNAILPDLKAASRRQVFEGLCAPCARATGIEAAILCEGLEKQEQETNGAANGTAVLHLRVKRLRQPFVLFARLAAPVDFDAPDGQPVDLAVLILSPETEAAPYHLQRLARYSRLMRTQALLQGLRGTDNPDALRAMLTDSISYGVAA
jgi:PTS system nitrogen regulatory IIA component